MWNLAIAVLLKSDFLEGLEEERQLLGGKAKC